MILSRLVLILVLSGGLSVFPCWGADPLARFETLQKDYAKLLKSEKQRLYRDKWEAIITAFDRFSEEYSGHPKAPAALFLAGRASQGLYRFSRREKDARVAAGYFDAVAKNYAGHNLADDALVMAAEIHEQVLGDPEGASERYQRAMAVYPHGDQVHLARKRMGIPGLQGSPSVPPKGDSPARKKVFGGPLRIEGIRHSSQEELARVVLDVSAPVVFSYNLLGGSSKSKVVPRLYVDLKNTEPSSQLPLQLDINGRFIGRIRTGRPTPNKTRVVLDLRSFADYRVFALENPARVVIEVAKEKNGWEQTVAQATPSSRKTPPDPRKDELSSLLEKTVATPSPVIPVPIVSKKQGLRRIVVDAGHGGKDPGAIGPGGAMEKDVVLIIAQRLAQRLKNELQYEVFLTRDKDIFIPLKERTAIANRLDADLFVSVHANASLNRNLRGIETYYLNFSKNEDAASVAARENGTTLAEVGDLEMILFDLMAHAKINESSLLADKVHKGMICSLEGRYGSVQDNGVRQGPFHVLLGANMPSILVEVAFISNRNDESRLRSGKYREGVVEGILAGIKNFDQTLNRMAQR